MRFLPLLVFLPLFYFSAAATDTLFVFKEFVVTGNRVTHQATIEREVVFIRQESYSRQQIDSLLERSIQNLQRLTLFNRVGAEAVYAENNNFYVRIEVTERWYWWPRIFFEVAEPNFNIWWQTRDFARANYGMELYKQNFRGRNEDLYLSAKSGYARRFRVYYRKPWLSPKSAWGIVADAAYTEQEEVNIGTVQHTREFYRVPGEVGLTERSGAVGMTYRPRIHTISEAIVGMVHVNIPDSLADLAPDLLASGATRLVYPKLNLRLRHDTRDNPGYPLSGFLFETLLGHRFFNLLNPKMTDLTEWYTDVRLHRELGTRWYGALQGVMKWKLRGQVPYLVQRGFGYHDLVRGFELSVIDGQSYTFFSTNLKYALIPKREINLRGKFTALSHAHYALYWTTFSDAGYVRDTFATPQNPLANTWIISIGSGLDFSTYYDTVIRAEVSFNSFGRPGFFVHFRKIF